jgi:membrane protease YdiL (CAAX protease family)
VARSQPSGRGELPGRHRAVGALLLWVATFGFGEETGWRGYALPRLQQRHRALTATLILAVFWGRWHVPTFFYLPTYVALGLAGVLGFGFGLLLGAIMLTWLYNSTGGSLFAVALWHALYDFLSASPATTGTMTAVMSVVVMLWAIAILITTRHDTLSSSDKVATCAGESVLPQP